MKFLRRNKKKREEKERAELEAKNKEFMASLPEDIRGAAEHTTSNRRELEQSKKAGCYYCLDIFKPNQIWEWINEGEPNEFPMCPYCRIDSVYGDASGYPVTRKFLLAMNRHWFGGDGEVVNKETKKLYRDTLELVLTDEGVRVVVNGFDLIDSLREYEEAYAKLEDPSPPAGSYSPVSVEDFLKHSYDTYSREDLLLFNCECKNPGCWPMVVRVERIDDIVRWSNFQQPHRDKTSHHYWNYTNFGPFRFDAKDYDKEMRKLSR